MQAWRWDNRYWTIYWFSSEYEKERANEDEFTSKLDHDYKEVLKYMEETGDYDELSNAWQKASDMEE